MSHVLVDVGHGVSSKVGDALTDLGVKFLRATCLLDEGKTGPTVLGLFQSKDPWALEELGTAVGSASAHHLVSPFFAVGLFALRAFEV